MPLLITMVTFFIVTAIVVSGYYLATAESPTSRRLRQIVSQGGVAAQAKPTRKAGGSRLLKRLLAVLGQYSLGGDESSLAQSLSYAGIRSRNAAALFVGARTLFSLGPALLLLVSQVSAGKPLGKTLLMSTIAWFYGHILVNYWLKRRARRRIRNLEHALPDSLDLMVVCLEAGLGLNATIARVGEERATMNDPLGEEFNQVSRELREGRSREECLRALGERNGVEDLVSLAGLIVQSDKLGASMAKTLRAHADVLRTRRRQRAEEAARKLPIKMLFPLAAFVLPALLIVAVGPSLLRIKQIVSIVKKH